MLCTAMPSRRRITNELLWELQYKHATASGSLNVLLLKQVPIICDELQRTPRHGSPCHCLKLQIVRCPVAETLQRES